MRVNHYDECRQDRRAARLSDIENAVDHLLRETGLAEALEIDEIVADVTRCDERMADAELRSTLKIPGYGPSRRMLARMLRAFADGLEHLEMEV